MKKILMMVLMAGIALSTNAQWNNWHTTQAISGGVGILGSIIASSERKKAMEIFEREKAQYQPTFEKVYNEAKSLESEEKWADALDKYEEAAKLNCKYGYTDQMQITRKINGLYVKAGRTDDGPSILNNDKTILPSYSNYRYVRENPIYVNKKSTTTKIVRVACSDTETRLEMEFEGTYVNAGASIKGTTYIKGDKGGKLSIVGVENITMAPNSTKTPWPGQKLRFVLIFPPLPDNATEFDLIEPSSEWKFKDIKCK